MRKLNLGSFGLEGKLQRFFDKLRHKASPEVLAWSALALSLAVLIALSPLRALAAGGLTSPTLKPVLQFMDTNAVLDTSSTNIPASGSAKLTIVSALTNPCTTIRVSDTTGYFIGVYEGASLRYVINPGMDGEAGVRFNAGSTISVRNMANSAISTGSLLIQFL